MSQDLELDVTLPELLFPTRFLRSKRVSENPLFVHTQRRGKRWWRRLATLVFGIILLVLGTYTLMILGRWNFRIKVPLASVFLSLRRPNPSAFEFHLVLAPLAFFLLRFHLFVNDQSHQMRSLSKENLSHLLQTPLTGEDYFLHHFLLFCRHFEALVLMIVAASFVISVEVLIGAIWWVDPANYWPITLLIFMTSLIWIAGSMQYVLEWRWFAGNSQRGLRLITSFFLSLVLAVICNTIAIQSVRNIHPALSLGFFLPIAFYLGASITRWMGNETYAVAHFILRRRFRVIDSKSQ